MKPDSPQKLGRHFYHQLNIISFGLSVHLAMANVRRRTWFRSAGSNDHAVFDDEANSHHQWLSEEGFIEQPDNIEYSKEFMYPNATLKPHLTRKHGG